jgi:hypothetical protein
VKLTTHLRLVPSSKKVKLYLHSPVLLHGIVFIQLSTETKLPFTLLCIRGSVTEDCHFVDGVWFGESIYWILTRRKYNILRVL